MSRILRHLGNKDFKRTRQRQIGEQKELAAQKLKEWKEEEAERKQIEEIARPLKSDWREETQLQESDWIPVAGSIANSSAQTFQYTGLGPDGPTDTFSGLGGVEAMPSSVSVTQFGDTFDVDAPNYSQLGLQGYAPPLGGVQRQTQQSENERIDAEIRKLEEQIKESKAKETAAIDAWNAELLATMNRHGREWEAVLKKDGVYNPEKHKGLQARHDAEIEAVWDKEPKTEPYETERQNLRAKIVELEKQRPINQQLDASQQAYPNLPMMNARIQAAVGTAPITSDDERLIANLSPTPHMVNLFSPGSGAAGTLALQYAKGDMTPMTKSPGADFDRGVLNMIDAGLTKGIAPGSVTDRAYSGDKFKAMRQSPIRVALGQFNYEITSNGIRVKDKFNFNKNVNIGFLDIIPELQDTASTLVDIGNRRAILSGQDPSDDNYGIPIDYTIPWSQIPAELQNKLDPNQRFVPIVRKRNRRGRVVESTWSKLKKHR
jgi:hypothetical protein